MNNTITILAFAGSTRRGSYNQRLVRIAAQGAEEAGAEVTLVQLREYPMPLYDGDLEDESGIPEHGMRFKKLLLRHQGLLISAPEYNGSISAVLKNAIDWASRQAPGETPLQCFRGKVVGLLSASPGGLGGVRGLAHVRTLMGGIGCLVLPDQVTVNAAHQAFDENGRLEDANRQRKAHAIGAEVASTVRKLST